MKKLEIPGITKVRSSSKTDLVVEKITEAIMGGEFGEGEFLPNEEGLCRRLGVSRSILREATRVLAYRGLLEIRQGRGTVVRVPRQEVSEETLSIFMRANRMSFERLMEVRKPVEIEIARLAAARRSAETLGAMKVALEKMERPGKDVDLGTVVRVDGEFHQALVKATDNPLVAIIINSIVEYLRESRAVTLRVAGFEKAGREHRAVYEAVKAGNAELAARCMERHMDSTWEDLRRATLEVVDG